MILYFIVNPSAKNEKCKKTWKKIERTLRHHHIRYHVVFTKAQGDGTKLAQQIAEHTHEPFILIAVGGDGTMHEVMNGIAMYDHVTVGYIPAGTGNDFARGIKLSITWRKALSQMLSSVEGMHVDSYDIGAFKSAKQGVFVNNVGCGFDAHISRKVNASKWKQILNRLYLGKFVYVFYLLKEMFLYKPTVIQLTVDQKQYTFSNAWLVTVANHPYYGGGMKIAPFAQSNDQHLDVVVVDNISRLKLLALFVTVFWGGHIKMKEVHTFRGKYIHICSNTSLPLHADGEQIGEGEITISANKQIRVLK
ncbi:diacylglycerol kinase [Anoxybacillus kestanbolensis]|uniref:Lipid kinase, YegS/Rv2252/BmrU family n=2 Tax=Anoxybacillus TaxID=150247 RepID=A0A1I0T195_9BACL|nr:MULTISPECIES: diacylglycerol kinase family protein [Anoxybacillus]OOE04326.1 diacylglycerol kinase [Anoxybacillus kestanbolensis]SFA45558.1 lipid kinase, YegS/Rv2252/BmrU family [Anoxybacillus pushchinoensis]